MSDDLRLIVDALNAPPFSKGYTLIKCGLRAWALWPPVRPAAHLGPAAARFHFFFFYILM
jgi:hypothetical protein